MWFHSHIFDNPGSQWFLVHHSNVQEENSKVSSPAYLCVYRVVRRVEATLETERTEQRCREKELARQRETETEAFQTTIKVR